MILTKKLTQIEFFVSIRIDTKFYTIRIVLVVVSTQFLKKDRSHIFLRMHKFREILKLFKRVFLQIIF